MHLEGDTMEIHLQTASHMAVIGPHVIHNSCCMLPHIIIMWLPI